VSIPCNNQVVQVFFVRLFVCKFCTSVYKRSMSQSSGASVFMPLSIYESCESYFYVRIFVSLTVFLFHESIVCVHIALCMSGQH
jgi:hypothetical protein